MGFLGLYVCSFTGRSSMVAHQLQRSVARAAAWDVLDRDIMHASKWWHDWAVEKKSLFFRCGDGYVCWFLDDVHRLMRKSGMYNPQTQVWHHAHTSLVLTNGMDFKIQISETSAHMKTITIVLTVDGETMQRHISCTDTII